MRRLALLVALLACSAAAQSTSNTSSRAGAETTAVTACEQLGLVSITVRGAPNVFCVNANTCNTNYIGSCPGASAVDVKGVVLTSGSCCASLENTGDVGCVDRQLIARGQFQCIAHPGSSDSAEVIDITTATPPPSTAAPTTPPPTTPTPSTSASKTPTPPSSASNADDTTVPATTTPAATTATPAPTSQKPGSTPIKPPPWPISSGLSSSTGSSSGTGEPDAGEEPPIKTPTPTRTSPVAPLPPADVIASLPPITEVPRPSHWTHSPDADHSKTPVNATGDSSTSSGGFFASSLNGNVVLLIVLGAVASVAVVLGALIFRRRESSAPASVTSSVSDSKLHGSDVPPLTLDNDDDWLEDLQFRQTDAFSPIFVQPTQSYTETTTPGHDRQSFFL